MPPATSKAGPAFWRTIGWISNQGKNEERRREVARGRGFLYVSVVTSSAVDVSGRRQYARLVHRWDEGIGLESAIYGTHSLRRTKAAQIYRKTGNLRAVQLLLGHTKLESTVRYLGIEVDDALEIAEQIDL